MRFETIESLVERRAHLQKAKSQVKRRVVVCAGTGCVAGGALELYGELLKHGKESGLNFQVDLEPCGGKHKGAPPPDYVSVSGCHGFCQMGPLVHILPDDILYTKVQVEDAAEIIKTTFKENQVIERLLFVDPKTKQPQKGREDIAFYNKQTRIALASCGVIDPENLDDYVANGGYEALTKALTKMTPEQIIDAVDKSGLRGRGGGGFRTGKKWRSALKALTSNGANGTIYVICNGDEGDPGAFMDRSIMEGDPFKVLEGMTIGAFALGASQGYIYVRHEYPLAVKRLQKAIETARKAGLLGDKILGTDFSFDIKINRGGGAFVCGESSALMKSVEGLMGEPRPKYVHSTEKGLYDKPTVLNNVESWVCIPPIITKGAKWFAGIGTKGSTGTKAFSLVGKVNNTGLVEVPMGATMREIVFDIGGGIINDRPIKAVQTGGPSGGCLPERLLDTPVDFDTLTDAGSMMGSGGMIVMDDRNCMVDVAKYFVNFLIQESCGKCVPCREGLQQLHDMLERICTGHGRADELDRVKRLAKVMEASCLCALGKTAVNPVLSTLRYFEDEYRKHIEEKKCPAGVCKELITYSINDNCTGCMLCVKPCPVQAISGVKKKKHVLDASKCTRCGVCESVCNDNAISVE